MPHSPVSDVLPLLQKGLFATWEMPELTSFNKLPPRATFIAYPTRRLALEGDREKSPWHVDLNGTWDFSYQPTPDAAARFLARKTMLSDWVKIPVPSSWQMQGFDRNHYTNVVMPFRLEPPAVPMENPTGIYRRVFQAPSGWKKRRIVVHFGGANSLLYVFLNGRFIGLSKDSHLPAEFDLTEAISWTGENELIAVVVKWSDSTYIEDQDQWWMSGLQREVYLHATPHAHLADFFVRAGPNDDYRDGTLQVAVSAGFVRESGPVTVQVELFDASGKAVLATPLTGAIDGKKSSEQSTVHLSVNIRRPRAWSAENPYRYTLLVGLKGPEGEQWTQTRVGFRRVEVKNRQMLVNGQAVLIKGVNHHDHDDTTGKAISRERMLQDIRLMKQCNMNAVRTSHYPKDPAFLDLCDEYGLYVIGEANIESHDFMNRLCHDPRYTLAFTDRVMRMVVRDKNHPSILIWSLGNESGYGPSQDASAGWVRGYDPTRLLHYEQAGWIDQPKRPDFRPPWHNGSLATDLICPMYAGLEALQQYVDTKDETRPLILCEYSHAMGNSNGSLSDYWAMFEKNFHRGLQGGFIWEWVDHGIRQKTKDGEEFWAYGGDFGDRPNDLNFVCDGLVWPDRQPHPAVAEFRYLAQPVKAVAFDPKTGVLQIRNKQNFETAAWLRGKWELKINGSVRAQGVLPGLRAKAGQTESVRIRLPRLISEPDEEAFLNVRFESAANTAWCEAGHLVGWEQFALPFRRPAPSRRRVSLAAGAEPLRLSRTREKIVIENELVYLAASAKHGRIETYRWHGHDLLLAGPELQIWRGPTDNDGIKGMKDPWRSLEKWRKMGLDRAEIMAAPAKVRQNRDGTVTLLLEHIARCAASARAVVLRHAYALARDGTLQAQNVFTVDKATPDLPRLGVTLRLSSGFEKLKWFGRGPFENYADRKSAAMIDLYESTVTGQYVPYIMPQEHGNHTDVRWISLENGDGPGLWIGALGPLEFSASHFTAHDLYAAHHTFDLKPRPETVLNLDLRQRGLGTQSCGPDTLPAYRIMPGRYAWNYLLRGLV